MAALGRGLSCALCVLCVCVLCVVCVCCICVFCVCIVCIVCVLCVLCVHPQPSPRGSCRASLRAVAGLEHPSQSRGSGQLWRGCETAADLEGQGSSEQGDKGAARPRALSFNVLQQEFSWRGIPGFSLGFNSSSVTLITNDSPWQLLTTVGSLCSSLCSVVGGELGRLWSYSWGIFGVSDQEKW